MKSQQAQSTEAAPTPNTRGFGKVDLNVSVACMVHRLVLAVGGTGMAAWATRSWGAAPLQVSSSARLASQGRPLSETTAAPIALIPSG